MGTTYHTQNISYTEHLNLLQTHVTNRIFIEVFTIWGAIIKVIMLRTNWSQFLSKLNHEVHHLYVLRDTTMNCCLLAWVQGILFRKFGFNFWFQFYFLIVFLYHDLLVSIHEYSDASYIYYLSSFPIVSEIFCCLNINNNGNLFT